MSNNNDNFNEPLLDKESKTKITTGNLNKKNPTKKELVDDSFSSADSVPELIETRKIDPIHLKKISLGTDLYSLTWHSLKKDAFKNKYIRGVKVDLLPQDYFNLYINFIFFVMALCITVLLIVQEALIDDVYVEGDWQIAVLRMLLVLFTQMQLSPELELGYAKFLYPLVKKEEFYHPSFAIFIGFSHVFICCVTILGLIFFICTADEFADPVINFAGICVLSELDDWFGDLICSTYVLDSDDFDDNEDMSLVEISQKRKIYSLKNLNERMTLYNKLAMLKDDTNEVFIEDHLIINAPFYVVWFEKIWTLIPWKIVLPLSTIPISFALPYYSQLLRAYFGYPVVTN